MLRSLSIWVAVILLWCAQVYAAPSISSVTASNSCGLYEKYEVTFDVSTVASVFYWPYDPSPAANTDSHPDAIPAGVGVTVDGLFSNDNWKTTFVQPAFYCQSYYTDSSMTASDGSEWIYPDGDPAWKIRFAPTATGDWKYKIRITDAGGTTTSSEYSFTCVQSSEHGFVRISPSDGRYFELSDGKYLPMIGFAEIENDDFDTISNMGVNLTRSWWQSSNPSLALFGAGGQGGDQVIGNLNYTTDYVRPGRIVSSKVPNLGSSWTSVWLGINTTITSIKHNTRYRFSCTVKTVGVTGDGDYGLFIGEHPSLVRSARLTGDNDWQELSLDITSDSTRNYLRVYVAETNVTSGTSYLSDWSLKEYLNDGSMGPELLPRPDLQSHTNYSQKIAWAIDKQLECARQNGIYVTAVIEEKGDSFFSKIQADGTWGASTNDNVYADSTHACRTYQQYYWRYLIARYSYSTALHSIELFNEGDPFNGNHYDAIESCGAYFNENDPNKHLVTSSNWHSFPPLMWNQDNVGIADIHMYLGRRVASGGNRLWPGWDGNWTIANYSTSLGDNFEIDSTVSHSGSNSLKITVPAVASSDINNHLVTGGNAFFTVAAPPGHTLRLSMWVKGQNINTYGLSWVHPGGIALQYSQGGGDFAGYPSGTGSMDAPWGGTYDWQKIEYTFTVPTTSPSGAKGLLPEILLVTPYYRATNAESTGYLWLDDFVIEDLASNIVLNYNGGFENWQYESYDVVAGHCAYSRLARSYQLNKPVIRGEVALCYMQRFTDTYKGFLYKGTSSQPGEDQLLIDDTEGVWWRKWIWANIDPGGLTEIYWWPTLPMSRDYTYGKAYQAFMSDIPLSNGKYVDAEAEVTNSAIRVLGQKDLTNNYAHLWIDNAPYTWKAVVDHNYVPQTWDAAATYASGSTCGYGSPVHIYKSLQASNKNHAITDTAWWEDSGTYDSSSLPALPSAVSGKVTVSGFAAGDYRVEWWNTSTGQITQTQDISSTDGSIALTVSNLQSDTACKIYPKPATIDLRILVPSSDVIPGQTVTVTVEYTNGGATDARNVSISARVPALMEYVSGSAEQSGGTWDSQTETVTWVIDTVAAKETGTRTFRAKVD
ncbi:MAG: hypothetical protein ABFD49_05070 [Armatimonadota bacterium]|nr:DUF11 domain-containing protein [bacterium]